MFKTILLQQHAELATRSACITYGAAAKLCQVTWWSILECVLHGVHGRLRLHGGERVHSTIEQELAEVATHSACVTWGGAKVRTSWSSWSVKSSRSENNLRSEKSSRYNRKRASGAHYTQCVHYKGCSSKATSGNMGESHEKICEGVMWPGHGH